MKMATQNGEQRSEVDDKVEQRGAGGGNPFRRTAVIVGLLFITATVAGFMSAAFTGPILEADDYLTDVNVNEGSFLAGAFAVVVMGLAGAGIGISMYPVLRRQDKGMALGAAGFRIIEGAVFCAGAILLLLSVPIAQEYVDAGSPDGSYLQTLGELSTRGLDFAMVIGGIAFSIAAMLYYYLFYQSKLIPVWLSVFGLIAVVLSLVQSLITYSHGSVTSASEVEVLHLPIFVQEMILAIWLIAKGFNPSAVAALEA